VAHTIRHQFCSPIRPASQFGMVDGKAAQMGTGVMKSWLKSLALAAAFMVSGAGVKAASVNPLYGTEPVKIEMASFETEALQSFTQFKRGKVVRFDTSHQPGSVIIRTKTNKLYYVLGSGFAIQYRVATAKKGFEWKGQHRVSSKAKWPDWRPPTEMRERKHELPEFMAGGPENPLGARALYLGSSIYRIHGTNEPKSIGKAASSGCIRMLNDDVTELFAHVKLGAVVEVR
jgi:lipoprotein-anchoring transpeptidase ErfK/SrfK